MSEGAITPEPNWACPGEPVRDGPKRSVTFRLSVKDLLAFSKQNDERRTRLKRTRPRVGAEIGQEKSDTGQKKQNPALMLLWLWIGIVIVIVLSLFEDEQGRLVSNVLYVIGGCVVGFLSIVLLFQFQSYHIERHAGSERTLIISAQGLIYQGPFSRTVTDWRGIEEVIESADHIFLYSDVSEAYIVPKNAFVDDSACKDFYALALRYHQLYGPEKSPRQPSENPEQHE
jgi:hypothetical protein